MKCPQCGAEVSDKAERCFCGYDLKESKPETSKQKKKGGGIFDPEKKGIEKGVVGGLTMMAIAVIWFVAGYAAGYIFYYPPILFLIGVFALVKGLITGNISGKKEAAAVGEAAPSIGPAEKISVSSVPELFDVNRFGFNFPVGIGYFAAMFIGMFTWPIAGLIFKGYPFYLGPLSGTVIIIIIYVLEAGGFLVIIHRIKNTTNLILAFGGFIIVLGFLNRLIFHSLGRGENMHGLFQLEALIMNFVYGALTMGALVIAIRFWGLKWWSFVLGFILAFSLQRGITHIILSLEGGSLSLDIVSVVSTLMDAIVFGLLIYLGLVVHLRKKGYSVSEGYLIKG